MNRWQIPEWLEFEVRERDRRCVYCGFEFFTNNLNRRGRPSWEHIINDARIVTRENIALCCIACNASKGAKPLIAWMKSEYCKVHGITPDSVATIVKAALASQSEALAAKATQ